MNLSGHALVSAAAGGTLATATGEPALFGLTVAAGILPDADHLLDYFNWYVRLSPGRLFMLFHGWEYLIAVTLIYGLIYPNTWMLALAIGYGTQIVGDQIAHRPRWNTYFLLARLVAGFRWESMVDQRPADRGYESLVASVPFFREPLRGWFVNRVDLFPDIISTDVKPEYSRSHEGGA